MKVVNEAGEAISVANVVVEKEATPPPRPPEPVTDSGTETRDHSPASRSTTSGRELGPAALMVPSSVATSISAHRFLQRAGGGYTW